MQSQGECQCFTWDALQYPSQTGLLDETRFNAPCTEKQKCFYISQKMLNISCIYMQRCTHIHTGERLACGPLQDTLSTWGLAENHSQIDCERGLVFWDIIGVCLLFTGLIIYLNKQEVGAPYSHVCIRKLYEWQCLQMFWALSFVCKSYFKPLIFKKKLKS